MQSILKVVGGLIVLGLGGCASSNMPEGQADGTLGDEASGSDGGTSTGGESGAESGDDEDSDVTLSTSVSASTTFTTTDMTSDPSTTDPTDTGSSEGPDSDSSSGTDDSTGGPPAGCNGLGPQGLLLHSTLDDAGSISNPDVGAGSGSVSTVPADDFVAAADGSGIRLDAPGEVASFPQVSGNVANIDFTRGTIDFCLQPAFDHVDSAPHELFMASTAGGSIRLRKAGGNNGNMFNIIAMNDNGLAAEYAVPSIDYSLSAGTWYRVTVSWDFSVGQGVPNLRAYLDGVELVPALEPTGPAAMPTPGPDDEIRVGAWSAMGNAPDAVFDDFKLYDSALVP